MLKITIPGINGWDPYKEEFVETKETTLILEHSLISLQKWEAKWHKPYLKEKEKTAEEILDYIKCMTLTQNVDPEVYSHIPEKEIEKIAHYIEDPMTATTFSNSGPGGSGRGEVVTAEIIYYWMIALNIPMEYRKWHLNQLLTLIRVCEIKNSPGKKMSSRDINARNKSLNAQRKAMLHTHG